MREIKVTIEGPTASGKSQIANFLAEVLALNGSPVFLLEDGTVERLLENYSIGENDDVAEPVLPVDVQICIDVVSK